MLYDQATKINFAIFLFVFLVKYKLDPCSLTFYQKNSRFSNVVNLIHMVFTFHLYQNYPSVHQSSCHVYKKPYKTYKILSYVHSYHINISIKINGVAIKENFFSKWWWGFSGGSPLPSWRYLGEGSPVALLHLHGGPYVGNPQSTYVAMGVAESLQLINCHSGVSRGRRSYSCNHRECSVMTHSNMGEVE